MPGRSADDLPFDPDLGEGDPYEIPAEAASARRSGHRPPGMRWATLVAVSVGGVFGGTARYGVEQAFPVREAEFPWATLAVNAVGAFVLALVLVLILEMWRPRRYLQPFVAIGFLGSFTTFSTWMLEVHDLASAGAWVLAAAYLGASLAAGLGAAVLGLLVGRAVSRTRTGLPRKGRA